MPPRFALFFRRLAEIAGEGVFARARQRLFRLHQYEDDNTHRDAFRPGQRIERRCLEEQVHDGRIGEQQLQRNAHADGDEHPHDCR